MTKSNRYFRFSTSVEAKFRHLVGCFALYLTATQTAHLPGISLRSVNSIHAKTAAECERQSPLEGVREADKSYFGPQRVRGRCGCGAGGKTITFGLLKRDDRVYTAIVPNTTKVALQAVIRGRANLKSVVHTDGWAGYHGLVDLGYDKPLRVEHRENVLPSSTITSTASRASGAWQNAASQGSAECQNAFSTSTSKRQNFAPITATITSTKNC